MNYSKLPDKLLALNGPFKGELLPKSPTGNFYSYYVGVKPTDHGYVNVRYEYKVMQFMSPQTDCMYLFLFCNEDGQPSHNEILEYIRMVNNCKIGLTQWTNSQ